MSATRVEFHFNVPDRVAYACRLLRKASRQQLAVGVWADEAVLRALSPQLWTLSSQDFLPHCLLPAGEAMQALSPIWLSADLDRLRGRPVLLNLSDQWVADAARWPRLVELVPADDDGARQAARQRWRRYAGEGHTVVPHDVAATPTG